ncbi:sodium/hydrogen exchanger 10-like [Anneissia japonica]|uniref:sodium/hydrogen exchanger 10-like n=1 Tax=Anneissia japonica TaxID=1529436 RepID=UPI0014259D50|nr:sodium/hydrogen exchanger 10-like [Anneissia japonica]
MGDDDHDHGDLYCGNASNLSDHFTGDGHPHTLHHPHPTPYGILFLFACCALGALVRILFKKLPIPYTVILLILGTCLGILSNRFENVSLYTGMAHMDPHLIMHVFLPVLIFESAFAMDVHIFMKSFIQVCILAVLGLMVATVLTSLIAKFTFSYNWGWNVSMMFGAIVSATDPVAVVALLKDLGASKQLGTIIEGESLLNDGCSIVVFTIFKEMAIPGQSKTATEIIVYFIRVALGGPAFGFLMAKFTTFWLSRIFNDALAEITITLASTYLTFYIGESIIKVSGVLAVVVLGLVVNAERTSISPEVEVFLHRFWEVLAYVANTLIFFLVGVVITERAMENVDPIDWFYMFTIYVGINIIRAIVIAIFSPILARIGYGLSWRNAVVMAWGGLRGAVGLALALLVEQTDEFLEYEELKNVGSKVLLHTSGIVILTLLVNATTIQSLLKTLGMSDISIAQRLAMANAVKKVKETQTRTLSMLKADRFLADAEWSLAERVCDIRDPYRTEETGEGETTDDPISVNRKSTCPCCKTLVPNEPSQKEYDDMSEEARLRMLKAEKISYWKQFEHGMLSKEATRVLVGCTESAADEHGELIKVDEIKKNWKITGIYPYLKRKLEEWISVKKKESIPPPDNKIQKIFFTISMHQAFEMIIYVVIFANMIPIILEFVISQKHLRYDDFKPYMRISNFNFMAIYIVEALIKAIGLRKYYLLSHWNKLDLLIILVSIIDITVDETFTGTDINLNTNVLKIPKLFRTFRSLRMLRLVKALIPRIISFLNTRINKKLSLGYDVGKGFVIGEEEVNKFVDHMVDNQSILNDLKRRSETSRLEVIRELGLLQREHPGIAISVKTRQAIRTVLNHSRDTICELQGAGLLDETDAHKLQMHVEIRMKRLLNAPASIPPPPPEFLLRNVAWLEGDTKLIEFIKARAELLHYDFHEVIIKQGEKPNGIYLIVSGMVKLLGSSEDLDNENQQTLSSTHRGSHEVFEDYLTAGNVIGEMGLLTGKPRNATVTCETSVLVYYINLDDMHTAIETFTLEPSLEGRLWRVCGIRIATQLLLEQTAYQGWTQEKVKLHLEKSRLIDLRECNYILDIEDNMDDVILIQGSAINAHTRDELFAPCVIHRNVHRLQFDRTQEPEAKLLVVLNNDIVATELEAVSSFADVHSSRLSIKNGANEYCMQHSLRERSKTSAMKEDDDDVVESTLNTSRFRNNKIAPQLVNQSRNLGPLTRGSISVYSDRQQNQNDTEDIV